MQRLLLNTRLKQVPHMPACPAAVPSSAAGADQTISCFADLANGGNIRIFDEHSRSDRGVVVLSIGSGQLGIYKRNSVQLRRRQHSV